MTRRERIVVLLEHYQEVQPGLVDTDSLTGSHSAGGYALLAAGCWSHRSYRELERVARMLRLRERMLYWHLAGMYFRSERRRMAICPRCLNHAPPERIGDIHRHGQRSVTLVPIVIRVTPRVSLHLVGQGIDWLDDHWQGGSDLPEDLLGHVRPQNVLASRATVVTLAPKIRERELQPGASSGLTSPESRPEPLEEHHG